MTSECKPAVPGEVQHHCELIRILDLHFTKCKDNNIISKGIQKKVNITDPDKELKSDCQEYQNEASWKMQK